MFVFFQAGQAELLADGFGGVDMELYFAVHGVFAIIFINEVIGCAGGVMKADRGFLH